MKIVIFGNSVTMRVRPFEKGNLPYPFIIEKIKPDSQVILEAKGGSMIDELTNNPDLVYKLNADILIFNFGVVELSSRSVPRWFYEYLFYRTPRKKYSRLIQKCFKFLESKFRRILVFLRFCQPWYSANLFIKDYFKIIQEIKTKSNSKVIVLGINQPNSRVENQLPASKKRISNVNKKLKYLFHKENIPFIDPNEFIDGNEFPDGIHYNQNGHEKIANRIVNLF